MLRARIITAVILAAVFLGAMFTLPPFGWTLFTFVITLTAFWEWTRIAPLNGITAKIFLGVTFLAGLVLLYLFSGEWSDPTAQSSQRAYSIVTIAASLFWMVIVPLWLKFGWRPKNGWALAATGWLVIFPTWFAVIQHRSHGPWMLLGLMALVWVADIAAYFTGRAFGKHKLAPGISPGKTWEGVAGAVIGVLIYVAICVRFVTHSGDRSMEAMIASWPVVVIASLLLVALSITGDLFESWMKRGAGLKDSSNLLPGHGGVLDRLDALTSTLPVAPIIFLIATRLATS
ncbi:MAG: phosphatidate cytidylyltransferase [Pseudomonadota bacterium]